MDRTIFDHFQRQIPFEDVDFQLDFMGVKIRKGLDVSQDGLQTAVRPSEMPPGLMSSGRSTRMSNDDPTLLHPDCEDFFEWMDLLAAMIQSGPVFQMMELGAGYGRWAINAIIAARRIKGRTPPAVRAIAIEMDPFKFQLIKRHMFANSVVNGECIPVHAVIDYGAENNLFFLWDADSNLVPIGDVTGSYGISVIRSSELEGKVGSNRTVLIPNGGNFRVVNKLPKLRFEDLGVQGVIDFLTMDIQGDEYKLINQGIGFLSTHVRVMHVATHSPAIEDAIKSFLFQQGWSLRYAFSREKYNETPFGGFLFDDGIQCWVNPSATVN